MVFHALAAIGMAGQVRALGAPPDPAMPVGLRSPSGRWLTRTPSSASQELRVVHRAELHRVLADVLPEGSVRFGSPVLAAGHQPQAVPPQSRRGARLRLVAESGKLVAGSGTRVADLQDVDLVVAADGIGSGIRRSLPGDPGVRYAGYSAWRGVTEQPVDLPAAGETWGSGERFGHAPLADGRVYWFAVATMAAGSVFDDEHAEVLRRFGRWHEPIAELIAATPARALMRHDIDELAAPLDTFVHERVVLLGDAAHAMTPNLGQGGNQAIEDAVTLTQLLGDCAPGQIGAALARYDAERRRRTRQVAQRSRRIGAIAALRGPAAVALRNAAVRLTPGSVTGRASVRLQSWQPPSARPGNLTSP